MRWKWIEAGRDAERHEDSQQNSASERIQADLERRGLSLEVATRLSRRVCERASSSRGAEYEALLDGVSLAFTEQEDSMAEMERHVGDLQEIERLMSGFSTELGKLDEVLEVMTVHVRKMRENSPTTGDRILH